MILWTLLVFTDFQRKVRISQNKTKAGSKILENTSVSSLNG